MQGAYQSNGAWLIYSGTNGNKGHYFSPCPDLVAKLVLHPEAWQVLRPLKRSVLSQL